MKKGRLTRAGGLWPDRFIFMIHNLQKLVHMQSRALAAESDDVRKIASSQSSSSLSFSADAREKGWSLSNSSAHIQADGCPSFLEKERPAVAGQQVVFLHMYLQTRVMLRAFPIATPRGRSSSSHGGELFYKNHY